MLHLAATLSPSDPFLQGRRQRAASLAIASVLGFLLLIPLLTMATLRQQQNQVRLLTGELRSAESQLNNFRQALADSNSPAELEQRFQDLQGPRLDTLDRIQPMQLLRTRVAAMLEQLGNQLKRRRSQLPSADVRHKLSEILRTGFASLALAGGFAALARRPGVDVCLLDECWLAWGSLQARLSRQRSIGDVTGRGRSKPPEEDYILQLSGEHDGKPGI